ncbi:MAG: DUF2314 domain-containing protein [Pseudomonadota bacterium]
MVQVRCPDCGYLQSISEERFLNIAEDFLNCPHCHAKIPKTWEPVEVDSIPEDVKHKILAFSSRILNGGEINRDVVCALETLVRKYGAPENSVRALGLGYASVGEAKKAEEFLAKALDQDDNDKEVLQALLKSFMIQEKYEDAMKSGLHLTQAFDPEDDDVGRLCIALIRLDRKEEATRFLNSKSYINSKNRIIRKARKELTGGQSLNFSAILTGKVPFNKLFSMPGRDSLKAFSNRARSLVSSTGPRHSDSTQAIAQAHADPVGLCQTSRTNLDSTLWISNCEYWVYSPTSSIPSWELLKRSFLQLPANRQNRSRELENLENLIAKQKLTIDYILREEAGELFEYPLEMMEFNARELDAADYGVLKNAQMIIRVRFSDLAEVAKENVGFLARFVEAVRDVSGGVIQDAVSHVLWGRKAWERHLYEGSDQMIRSNILVELLDEEGEIWAHSHGMQKFGLPDVEIECVPREYGSSAVKLILSACETLVGMRIESSLISQPLRLRNSSVSCSFEYRKSDPEGHFPTGSFRIFPYTQGTEPASESALIDSLKEFNRSSDHFAHPKEKKVSLNTSGTDVGRLSQDLIDLKHRILEAHRKARSNLDIFRRSFQDSGLSINQTHAVKVGFPTQAGQYEWMWVSLDAWRGKSIEGSLENAPLLRTDLRKGIKVSINEAEIFDWVITQGNEILEGGFTERIAPNN